MSEDKQLVVVSEGAALTAQDLEAAEITRLANAPIDGLDEMGREDMAIPRLVLVQAQSDYPESERHTGEYYNTVTGVYSPAVNGLLLSVAKFRICFDVNFDREGKALCASDDGEFPRAAYVGTVVDGVAINGSPCAECPLSQFGADSAPPQCARGYAFAFMDVTNNFPFVVSMKRTAIPSARQLITVAKANGRNYLTVFSSKKIVDSKGNYFVPVITRGDKSTLQQLQEATALSNLGNLAKRVDQVEHQADGFNGNDPA